jgi:hypothetical protein
VYVTVYHDNRQSLKGIKMSTAGMFITLYLLPTLTIVGAFGTFLLAFGTNGDGLVGLIFIIVLLGLLTSTYITIQLVSKFVANQKNYTGILFSLLGWLYALVAVAFFIIFFHQELGF